MGTKHSTDTDGQTQSPNVSDTPLDFPRGSLPSENTVYSFEPPLGFVRNSSSTSTPALVQMEESNSDRESILSNTLPLIQQFTPPQCPDAIVSAAIAFGASHKTAEVISRDVELYSLFDPLFSEVASMNSTLWEISEDITSFTSHLISSSDGLRIIEAYPREEIQFNISLRKLSPQHTIAYRDNNVRIWLNELIIMTAWTNEAWQSMVSQEREVFDESLIKLMDILEARLSECEQAVLEIRERILKARGPLVKTGQMHSAQFGESWLKWAVVETIRMKGIVAQMKRFMN
ncbi:hypothetical protein L211DRAFT_871439 [Terfezia boudieri ATCC MYA-4762]|uniref:Uncharacterized protein n=1 Tax=Terfezia boudieri ATCC MYA-4762 TaxID=1051890 RepID=A0A3N4LEQ7_9PEZI|nr:hypothetical protein L211DRAFT_871439 [Terfezia boudieri ATCC MYA-4762]